VIIPHIGDTPWPPHPGQPVFLAQIDSTNQEAIRRAALETTNSLLLVAEQQTAGRGQRGQAWESDGGLNLLCTWLIGGGGLPSSSAFLLNMAVACALCDTGAHWLGNQSKIKWPNDLWYLPGSNNFDAGEINPTVTSPLIEDKKVSDLGRKWGGILIENQISGVVFRHSAIGFGLNINQTRFGQHLPLAASLKSITGKEVNRDEVLHLAINQMRTWLEKIKRDEHIVISDGYLNRLWGCHEFCDFSLNGNRFSARIEGVDPQTGELIIFDGRQILRGVHPELRQCVPCTESETEGSEILSAKCSQNV